MQLYHDINLQKVKEIPVISDVHRVKLKDLCLNNFFRKANSNIAEL